VSDITEGLEPRTPAELVASAVQTEREAAWFYRMMADMSSDDEARKTLLTLADDEESHATALLNLYFELTGHGITQPPSAGAEGDPNLFDFSTTSRRDALEFALQNETKAVEIYNEQADLAANPRVATVFRILADTERDHAAYIRLQLDRLDAPDSP
jgi:rubrerythrin